MMAKATTMHPSPLSGSPLDLTSAAAASAPPVAHNSGDTILTANSEPNEKNTLAQAIAGDHVGVLGCGRSGGGGFAPGGY